MLRKVFLLFLLLLTRASFAMAGDYVIGGGDTLQVSVWDVPQLSVKVTVRPDGKITLPAVGDIVAAGTTPESLAGNIRKALEKIVQAPVVTLTVEQITNNRIYVGGGGVPSQVVQVPNRESLFQFLCRFNSFEQADLENSFVMRDGKKIKHNFESLILGGDMTSDLYLEPNDIVFIPNYSNNKVYVVGAVKEPKYVFYRAGLKVMDAILEAGGFNQFADKSNVVIIRRQRLADGKYEKIELEADIKALLKGKDLLQNHILKPGDYINVKESLF